jgi:hypothetical protein
MDSNMAAGAEMDARALKLRIARAQLGTALDLFIRDKDAYSVHALACAGCEIIEGLAETSGASTLSTHILETHPDIDMRKISALRNQHWNALKHFYSQDKKTVRNDTDLMSQFSDEHNDMPLFMGWYDYVQVTGRLPVPVQVFQVWWYAIHEDTLTAEANINAIRGLFPGINSIARGEQKRRLRRSIERYRLRKDLLSDPRTEVAPLSSVNFT